MWGKGRRDIWIPIVFGLGLVSFNGVGVSYLMLRVGSMRKYVSFRK